MSLVLAVDPPVSTTRKALSCDAPDLLRATREFDRTRVHSYPGGGAGFIHRPAPRVPLLLVHVRAAGSLERRGAVLPTTPGSLYFLPNDAPVTFAGHGGGGVVLVELPHAVSLFARERVAVSSPLVISSGSGATALLRSFLDTLDQQLPGYRPEHPEWVQNCLGEMVERVLTECTTPVATPAECAVAAARGYIRSHLGDTELTPEQVARRAAVSLRTLNRLFAAEGDSVCGWIRHERLERCRADLRDPAMAARSIGQIAAVWGFPEAAHFSRAFKEAFGASPRAYRMSEATQSPRRGDATVA